MMWLPILVLLGTLGLWAGVGQAETVTLTWNANKEPDLKGYKLYQYDAANRWFPAVVLDKTKLTYTTPMITTPGKLFWILTSIDNTGNESKPSNEVNKVMVGTVVTPPPPVKHCVAATTVSPTEITIKGIPCVN